MEQTHSKLNRPTLSQRFYENRFVWISFAASALVMLLVYICFELIPFGSRTILRMDLYHQYGPLFAELYERLVGGESLIYSWDTGLGSSFLGNFYNYLSSPLSVIILLFGHSNIPEAIATMILLKAALASAAFAYYLKRSTGKKRRDNLRLRRALFLLWLFHRLLLECDVAGRHAPPAVDCTRH